MDLKVNVANSILKKYSIYEPMTKETLLRLYPASKAFHWGIAIHDVSNNRISVDTGVFLANLMNYGVPQAAWADNKKNLEELCGKIKKQDIMNKRVAEVLDGLDNKYSKAAKEAYFSDKPKSVIASELGISPSELALMIDAFMFSIQNSEFYSWIIEATPVQTSRELLIEVDGIDPYTAKFFGRIKHPYVEDIQIILSGARSVEDGMYILTEYYGGSKKFLRKVMENLVSAHVVELDNLKESSGSTEIDDSKPYSIISHLEDTKIETQLDIYFIKVNNDRAGIKLALDELVFSAGRKLDCINLHNIDNVNRNIYQITCSSV